MRRALVLAGLVAAAAMLTVSPASATGDTSTTFQLSAAGGLGISVPASASLGSASTGASSISASLGSVSVSDLRGSLLGSWTASVTGTDFTTGGATANETIAKANVAYWSGPATATTGTGVFTPGQLTSLLAQALSSSRTAFAATGVVGNNSATWSPTLVVTLPSSAVVGTYAGTVTHSVA